MGNIVTVTLMRWRVAGFAYRHRNDCVFKTDRALARGPQEPKAEAGGPTNPAKGEAVASLKVTGIDLIQIVQAYVENIFNGNLFSGARLNLICDPHNGHKNPDGARLIVKFGDDKVVIAWS